MDVTILIPCHNDCEKAAKLKRELKEYDVMVAHNGCNKNLYAEPYTLPWSNKARTINHRCTYNIKTSHTIVLDADIKIFPTTIPAIVNDINKYNTLIGMGHTFYTDGFGKYINTELNEHINGSLWYFKTSLVRSDPLPEHIIVEDTAWGFMMKKKGYKIKTLIDSVCEVNYFEPTFKKKFRQMVRYQLGGLQLAKHKLDYSWLAFFIINSITALFFMCGFFFGVEEGITLMLVFSYICMRSVYKKPISIKKIFKKYKLQIFMPVLTLTIVPIAVIYLFIKKKRIW